MTRDELLAALEAATGPSDELDKAIWLSQKTDVVEVKGVWQNGPQRFVAYHTNNSLESYQRYGDYNRPESEFTRHDELPRYTGSIDAALTLVPGGWNKRLSETDSGKWWAELRYGYETSYSRVELASNCATPALALCIAAIKVRQS